MFFSGYLAALRNKIFLKQETYIPYGVSKKDYLPFFFVLMVYPILQLAMKPNWMLGGGIYEEASTNYFLYANSPLWSEKIFATDSGYVPLPQRLIAVLASLLRFPDISIPYYYTWGVTIITGLMGAIFCLPRFRVLVKSDFLRILTSFIILLGINFDTATFINFTYFDIVPIAFCSALALADKTQDVPKWAWLLPLLFWAKPSVLSGLPMVCMIALISKPRFQKIAIVSALVAVIQMFTLYVHHQKGVFAFTEHYTLFEKISAVFLYFPTALSLYTLGMSSPNHKFLIAVGCFVLFLIGLFLFFYRARSNALLFVGLNIIFFSIVINVFAISIRYNYHMNNYNSPSFSRYDVTCFWGGILIVCGIIESLSKGMEKFTRLNIPYIGASLFFIWLVSTNLHNKLLQNNSVPISPFIGNSMWLEMAPLLKETDDRLCIPVDPFPRAYGRGCEVLYSGIEPQEASYENVPSIDTTGVTVQLPQATKEGNLLYISIPARPQIGNSFVKAQIFIKMKNGSEEIFSGGRKLSIDGGVILLMSKEDIKIKDIDSMVLRTDSNVRLLFNDHISKGSPVIMPMGFM